MKFGDNVGDPAVSNALARLSISCFISKIMWPLKLRLSCKVVEKRCLLSPQFSEGMPHILDMHFQIALTYECVTGLGRVPSVAVEKRKIGRRYVCYTCIICMVNIYNNRVKPSYRVNANYFERLNQ